MLTVIATLFGNSYRYIISIRHRSFSRTVTHLENRHFSREPNIKFECNVISEAERDIQDS